MSLKAANDNVESDEDYSGMFVGFVGEEEPSKEMVQVKIANLFDQSADSPKIPTVKYSPFGNGSGFGFFGTPQPTSKMVVTFQGGDINYPLGMGFLTMQGDFVGKVREHFDSKSKWGFVDCSNFLQVWDMENKIFYLEDYHDTKITLKEGLVELSTSADVVIKTSGNAQVETGGTAKINSGGDMIATSGGNIRLRGKSIQLN